VALWPYHAALVLKKRHLGLDGAIGFAVSGAAPLPPLPPLPPPPPAMAPLPPAVAPSPSPYQRPPPTTSPVPTASSNFGVAAARAAAARTAALDPTAATRPVAPPAAGLDILAAIESDDDDDDDMYGGLTDRAAAGEAGQAAGAEEVWLDAEEAALFGEGPLFVEGAPAAAAAAVGSAPASTSADNYHVSVGWGEGLLGGGEPAPALAPAPPGGGKQDGCAHKCADKQTCGHLCCKQGGTRRKRARAPTHAPTTAAAAAGAAGSPATAAAGAAVYQAANVWASRAPTPTSSTFWERFRAPETAVGEKRPRTPQAAELAPAPMPAPAPAFEFAPAPAYVHTPRAPAPPAAPASTPRPKPPSPNFLGTSSVFSKPLSSGGNGGDGSGHWWDVGDVGSSNGGGGSGGGGGGSGGGGSGGYAPPLAPSPLLLHGKKTALAGGGAVHQPPLPQSNPNPKAQPQSHPSAFPF